MSNPSSLNAFHSFPKLPSEIRLQVWNIILKIPQYIELRSRKYTSTTNPAECHWHWFSLTPISPLLHVNFESRTETLKTYCAHPLNININPACSEPSTSASQTMMIHKNGASQKTRKENVGMIYINPVKDMIVIHYPNDLSCTNQFNISTSYLACADIIHNLGISAHKVCLSTLLDISGMRSFLSPFRMVRKIFQIEVTAGEYEEMECRSGDSSADFGGYGGLVDIGVCFTKRSCGFWFWNLVRRGLESLEREKEKEGDGGCVVTVLGSENLVREGRLRPWWFFVDEIGE